MPIYEYRCEACGHELEALQKMSDAPLNVCPECSQPRLKKALSAAGFRLKGTGWYETDFKSGKKKNVHNTGESETKKSPGKSETKKTPGKAETKKVASSSSN